MTPLPGAAGRHGRLPGQVFPKQGYCLAAFSDYREIRLTVTFSFLSRRGREEKVAAGAGAPLPAQGDL